MTHARAIFGSVVVVASCVAAAVGGCVSNNATGPEGSDSGAPAEDTGG